MDAKDIGHEEYDEAYDCEFCASDMEDPSQYDASKDVTAVILAGGRGERMKPYEGAKAAVPVAGRPLLHLLLDTIRRGGIEKIHVCTGYRSEDVVQAIETYGRNGAGIAWSNAGEDATHEERMSAAHKKIDTKHVLTCYGDTLANVDIGRIGQWTVQKGFDACVTVAKPRCPFGVVRIEDGTDKIAQIEEKPLMPFWVNIGYVFSPTWAYLRLQAGDSLVDWINRLAASGTVVAHKHDGWHYTVNTVCDVAMLESAVADGRLA